MAIPSIDELEIEIKELKAHNSFLPPLCQILRELRHLRIELDKHFSDEAQMFQKVRSEKTENL